MRLFSRRSLAVDQVIVRRRGNVIAIGSIATLPCMVGALIVADEVEVHPAGVKPYQDWRLRLERDRIAAENASIRKEWDAAAARRRRRSAAKCS
jgi:hypothetical protein